MATKNTKNTAAVLDEDIDATEETVSHKATIEEAIADVVGTFGVSVKRSRLKGLRALAYFAFVNAIEDGTLDDLVAQTKAGVDELPTGWTLERAVRAEKPAPAEKPARKAKAAAPAEKPAAKPAAKRTTKAASAKAAPAKTTARKRPQR